MDAVRSLRRGVLPPAGEPICLETGAEDAVAPLFPDKALHWVDSGTSALALALRLVRQRHAHLAKPEVIIPAYCCPDLVSAALYAGFTPVLADLAPDSCHYDLAGVESCLSDRTLAIIGINFLGLPAPIEALAKLRGERPFALIEDCAQWFPQRQEAVDWQADYVVFSFGRGKAVNLLGGGLLAAPADSRAALDAPDRGLLKAWLYHGKCRTYNTLLRPAFYQLLARNPWMRLGETRYQPLDAIRPMPPWIKRLVAANLRAYRHHKRRAETAFREALAPVNQLAPLLEASPNKLLRYPLLVADEERRNNLLDDLRKVGLGATELYGTALPRVAGVPLDTLTVSQTEKAKNFAQRFITLPVHQGVREMDRENIVRLALKHLT